MHDNLLMDGHDQLQYLNAMCFINAMCCVVEEEDKLLETC